MGINMLEKEGKELIIYDLPNLINENNQVGNCLKDFQILQVLDSKYYNYLFDNYKDYSQVFKVKSNINYGVYAMKKISKRLIQDNNLQKEIDFIKQVDHPHIIKYYNSFEEEDYLYLIMEYMSNGDLESYDTGNKLFGKYISEEKLWEIFYISLSVLNFIHKQGKDKRREFQLKHIFLDEELNIKLGLINISSIINISKKSANNNLMINQKLDVEFLSETFFSLCFGKENNINNYYYKNNSEGIKYSEHINNFLFEIKNLDSSSAMMKAKNTFIKFYRKNTSIEATISCFQNYKNFRNYFSDTRTIYEDKKKKIISEKAFSLIQTLDINNRNQINDELYEFRKALEKININIKNNNKEIDPGNLISFFLDVLNSELNEVIPQKEDNDSKVEKIENMKYKILSKHSTFSPSKEKLVFKVLINIYNEKVSSFISKNFLNYLKITRKCINCGYTRIKFSLIYFFPINVNVLVQNYINKRDFKIMDAFELLKKTTIKKEMKSGTYCKECNRQGAFEETKSIYKTGQNLIIILDRGKNQENRIFVDFDEYLLLSFEKSEKYEIDNYNYKLIGIIAKKIIDEKNFEYVYYIKIGDNWIYSLNKGNEIKDFKIIKNDRNKTLIVVALFYYLDSMPLPLDQLEEVYNDISINKKAYSSRNLNNKMNNNININNNINNINNINRASTFVQEERKGLTIANNEIVENNTTYSRGVSEQNGYHFRNNIYSDTNNDYQSIDNNINNTKYNDINNNFNNNLNNINTNANNINNNMNNNAMNNNYINLSLNSHSFSDPKLAHNMQNNNQNYNNNNNNNYNNINIYNSVHSSNNNNKFYNIDNYNMNENNYSEKLVGYDSSANIYNSNIEEKVNESHKKNTFSINTKKFQDIKREISDTRMNQKIKNNNNNNDNKINNFFDFIDFIPGKKYGYNKKDVQVY